MRPLHFLAVIITCSFIPLSSCSGWSDPLPSPHRAAALQGRRVPGGSVHTAHWSFPALLPSAQALLLL